MATEFTFDDLITASEAKALGVSVNSIFFSQDVLLEGEKKKTSKEKKKLFISSKRVFLLSSQTKSPKVELNINLLTIKEISTPDDTHILIIYLVDAYHGSDKTKAVRLEMTDDSSSSTTNTVVALLSPMHAVLGADMASKRIQLVIAEKRKVQVLKSVDDNIKRVNQNRSHGTFPDIYSLLCDYIDIPMNDEVAWDIENTYNSHAITTLSLNDFPKLASRDMVPVIRSMEFSRTLDSIRIDGVKLCSECIDAIVYVCKNCNWLKGITINGSAGLKHDFITKLFQYGFLANTNCQIDTLDLSDNPSLEDKAIQQLATQLALVPHGLKKLSLNNTGISSIGYASLSRTFTKHPEISNTLWYLSLSRNHFSTAIDFQTFLSYFSTTSNKIQELYLSDTGVPLDQIFQALHSGSTNYLSVLDLSNNNKVTVSSFKNHNPKSLAYKQFFSTAKVLRECNLSNCKLTPEIVDQIMQGLNENSFLYNLSLNLSHNYFSAGTNAWPQLCSTIKCLHSLDLSYTSLDDNYLSIFSGIFSSHYLKELNLSGNFRKNKRLAGLVLADLLQSKDCQLKVLKVVDCKLGDQTSFILRSLIANSTLRYLDISGNLMNHTSAQTLARMISNNATLVSLRYDDNNLTIDSMLLISNALEYNSSITDMPLPLRDLVKIKREHEKDKQIDAAVTKIESFLLRNHSPSRYHSIHSSGRKFLLHLINEKQTLIDKKIETLEQKLQQVSEEDVNKEFITTITQLVNKCGTLSMVFENLYSERTDFESLSDDSAICDITQALKEEMTKKLEAESTEMMDKLQFAFNDIITPEVFKSTTQALNDVIQGKIGKKDDNPLPDSSLAETKLLNLISEGVSSNIATKHLDLARLLVNIVSDYIFTRLEETQDKLDKQIANNFLSPVRTPLSPEVRGRSSSINRFQMAFTSSMKRARVSCITTGPPFETEEDLNDDSVSRSNDQLPLSPDTESITCEVINDDKDVDLGDFILTLNEGHNDNLEEATYPSKDTPTVVDTSTSSDAIPVINQPTCPTTDDLSATPPPSPASTTISTDTTPSISDSTTISSNSSTPATIESTDDLLTSTATASRETVLEDTPPDTIASQSEPLVGIAVTPNKESTELERKTSTKKGLISKGLFGRSKKETKNVDAKSSKKDKKDKKDTTSFVRTPSNTSSDFTPPIPADEIVKSKPKTEVSFLNIDEVSSNAKQAPDISMFRSKPKGPPRRPPIRQATPSLTTKEPTPDSDVFSELVNQIPSGLDAVIEDKPKRLQLEYAKTVGFKRMSVMDPSAFTGAAIDFDFENQGKSPTTPNFESSLSDGLNINIGTPTQPPIILPKKPPYKGKVPILPPPNLASVLEGGLKATKLRNSRSSENIILQMNKEDTGNIPSSAGVLSSQLKKVTPPSRAKKPMLSTPERAPKPKFPDLPIQDQSKSFTNAFTACISNSANEEVSQQDTNSTNQKIKTEEVTLLSDSTDLTSDNNNINDNSINNNNINDNSTTTTNPKNIDKTEKNNDSSTINTETDQLDKENISDNINTAEKVLDIPLDATTIKESKISPTKPPTPVKPPSPAKFNKSKPMPAERKKLENSLNDKFELIVEDGQQTDDKFTPQLVNSSDADSASAISEFKQSSDEKIQSPNKNKLAASKSDEESHTSFISAEANSEGADVFDSEVVHTKRSSSMSSPKYNPSLPQNDKNVEKTKDNSSPLKTKDQTEQEISPNKPKPTTPKPQAFAIQTNAQNSPRRYTDIGVKPKIGPKKPIISPRKEIDSSDSHSDSSQKSDTPSKNIFHPLSDSYDANSNISESPEKQTEPTESK